MVLLDLSRSRILFEFFVVYDVRLESYTFSPVKIFMSKIRIKNFGPIKNGFEGDDGFIDIRKATIFIGNQGTGKSSVAKLISVMSWLEKALYIGELTEKYATSYGASHFCEGLNDQ